MDIDTAIISASQVVSQIIRHQQALLMEMFAEDSDSDNETGEAERAPATMIGSQRFHIDTFDNFVARLRLFRKEFQTFVLELKALGMESTYRTVGLRVTLEEALALCMHRLAYPTRLSEMAITFGRSRSAISQIINSFIKLLYRTLRPLVEFHGEFFPLEKMQEWAAAIARRRSPLKHCIGFMNGTFREVCRPIRNQEALYSGEHKAHGLRFQAITTPDGLQRVVLGPFAGRMNDNMMVAESQIMEKLMMHQKHLNLTEYFVLYSDSGYAPAPLLVPPYPKRDMTESQKAFNQAMSSCRIAVEWGFGTVTGLYSANDMRRQNKVLLSPCGDSLLHLQQTIQHY